MEDFSDATLVLVGHGSTLNARSAWPTCLHAAELRRRGIFREVQESFWKEEPSVVEVVEAASTPRVFVVPLFISEGYFAEEVIPRKLGFPADAPGGFPRIQIRGSQTRFYCAPVGSHPGMTRLILARAEGVVRSHSSGDGTVPQTGAISLFVAGHGTGRNENSRKAIERQVELIRALGAYHSVQAIFMEEEPRIGDCYVLATTRDVVVVPFFISDGLHTQEDIPVLLGESEEEVKGRLREGRPTFRNPTERQGRRVWYAPSIGQEPQLAEVILERVREAAAPIAGRVSTRR